MFSKHWFLEGRKMPSQNKYPDLGSALAFPFPISQWAAFKPESLLTITVALPFGIHTRFHSFMTLFDCTYM
jgi:hypothetical protein